MRHAIIVAHPDSNSLNLQIAKAYAWAVRTLGHEVQVRDLYRMGFDPCLRATEIAGVGDYHCAPDVQRQRELIGDAEVFAFVYPFWFNAPLAILKGYVDRVFSAGFGYDRGSYGAEALLDGKRLISFSSPERPTIG
jgi:NAD(P)H dehydrogenase (quinone)